MFAYLGLDPLATTSLLQVWALEFRVFLIVVVHRYKVRSREHFLKLPASAQYRRHLSNGGYRC